MPVNDPLYLIPALIAAGVGVQWLAARTRLPAILLLLGAGLALRPLLGLFAGPPTEFERAWLSAFVSLAVAVVLFEGGMSLNMHEARRLGAPLRRLLVSGVLLGFALVTFAARSVAGLSWATAAMLGAILVVTGPTVIIPMLRHARMATRPGALLKWEAIVNDPIGALLAYVVFAIATMPAGQGVLGVVLGLLLTSLLAGVLGALAGYLLGRALNAGAITEHLKTAVILAAVLVVFAGCEAIAHESGLLAVTVMGVVLGNTDNHSIADIRRFKERITTLLVAILFIVLSARLQPADLQLLLGPQLLLIALILLVVRPLVGLAATLGTDLPWSERAILGWIAPRGVVAAAVAGAFAPQLEARGYADAQVLVPLVFGVILATVVLHGLSLRPLARALGLAARGGNGVLLVGAADWAVQLAQTLAGAGAGVVLADTRFQQVSRARVQGLEVHHGDVLSEEMEMELPMEQVSWVLAVTDRDAYNALVCLRFAPELGRESVLQLTPRASEKKNEAVQPHLAGRSPWGAAAGFDAITARFEAGGAFKSTLTTQEFGWTQLRENNPDALFLFGLHQNRLLVLDAGAAPPAGTRVVYLA